MAKYLDENGLSHFWGNTRDFIEKHIVTIGDSFGHAADQGDGLWPVLVSSSLGLTLHNYCEGGAGYVRQSSYAAHNTFVTEINNAVADTSFDNSAVKVVIVYGGYNDIASNQDIATFTTNAGTVFSTAKQAFTNALIVVFGINSGLQPDSSYPWDTYINAIKTKAKENGVQFVNATYWGSGDASLFKTDKLHPSAAGSRLISNNILSWLSGTPILSHLGADDFSTYWRPGSLIQTMNATFVPTSAPDVYNVSFDFVTNGAAGAAWNFNFITLSYLRTIPYNLVVPVYKQTTDQSGNVAYEYAGCAFRQQNYLSAKFINAVASGDHYVTGQFVFNTLNDSVVYTAE